MACAIWLDERLVATRIVNFVFLCCFLLQVHLISGAVLIVCNRLIIPVHGKVLAYRNIIRYSANFPVQLNWLVNVAGHYCCRAATPTKYFYQSYRLAVYCSKYYTV